MRKMLLAGIAAATALAACNDPLSVTNENVPDVQRAYSTPGGVEQVISTLYQAYHGGTVGNSNDNVENQTRVLSFENYASVANFGMSARGALPRGAIDNSRGQPIGGNLREFSQLQTVVRTAANTIQAIGRLDSAGTPIATPGRRLRARAFAFLVSGIAHGTTAMIYDSATIIRPTTPAAEVPPFSGYRDVATAGLALIDSAIAIANSADAVAAADFTLPNTWINGVTLDRQGMIRLARSWKARIRAGIARTPAERNGAQTDWDAVIADAQNGITADLVVTLNNSTGWDLAWTVQHYLFGGWSMMTPFIIGMADTTGRYQTWLQTPITQRDGFGQFLIVTPDTRFPRGATRPAQQANSPQGSALPPAGLYYRNRGTGSTGDTPGDPWGNSPYDFVRFQQLFTSQRNGPWPAFTKVELDMLQAEGFIRRNRVAEAIPLINASRTRNGLPAIPATSDVNTIVPGGTGCVPQVPQGPNFTTVACGNVLEALKWEKRMESAFTGYAQWYLDSRGWGDLAVNTPLQWPVPFQELDARALTIYQVTTAATRGTYGF